MWKLKEFRDDNISQNFNNWKSARYKLLAFLNEAKPEVVSFSAYGQYGDRYKLIYKEREPID